eukprot:scaffold122_cov236-Pinguiococcus_pyrenoidosus.AAC.20
MKSSSETTNLPLSVAEFQLSADYGKNLPGFGRKLRKFFNRFYTCNGDLNYGDLEFPSESTAVLRRAVSKVAKKSGAGEHITPFRNGRGGGVNIGNKKSAESRLLFCFLVLQELYEKLVGDNEKNDPSFTEIDAEREEEKLVADDFCRQEPTVPSRSKVKDFVAAIVEKHGSACASEVAREALKAGYTENLDKKLAAIIAQIDVELTAFTSSQFASEGRSEAFHVAASGEAVSVIDADDDI